MIAGPDPSVHNKYLTHFLFLTIDVINGIRYHYSHDKIVPEQKDSKNIQQATFRQTTAEYSAYCT